MKIILKWGGGLFAAYVVFVILFETVYLGMMQPSFAEGGIPMLVLTTVDDDGAAQDKMLASLETDDKLYVSAHHWTRGWYHRAVENPNVQVEIEGTRTQRIAVVVTGDEFDSVSTVFKLPFVVRLLMGFPPGRDILRLDLTNPEA